MERQPSQHKPGDIIESPNDSYEIISLLGEGGTGVVYKARQIKMARVVALKSLHSVHHDLNSVFKKLAIEARRTAVLEHPNIVKVFSIVLSQQKELFLAMEYVEGTTLAHTLQNNGLLDEATFYSIFSCTLEALKAAHQAGVVHRDIKPANIIVTTDGGIKLMDFGLAKDLLSTDGQLGTTQTGKLAGSPAYMSPEQCRGEKVDARSDLYSLGCVMFTALTGHPPFSGENSLEVMYKHLHQTRPEMPPHIPVPLQGLILRALATRPSDRFESAEDMQQALQGCKTGQNPGSSRSRSRNHRNRHLLPYAVALCCLIIVPLSFIAAQKNHTSQHAQTEYVVSSTPNSAWEALRQVDSGLEQWRRKWISDPRDAERFKNELIKTLHSGLDMHPTPEVEWELYSRLGFLKSKSGDTKQAIQYAEEALEILRKIRPPEDREITDHMLVLAGYHREASRPRKAAEICAQAYEIRKQAAHGQPLKLTAAASAECAISYQEAGDAEKAKRFFDLTIKEFTDANALDSANYGFFLAQKGNAEKKANKFEEAIKDYTESSAVLDYDKNSQEAHAGQRVDNALCIADCYWELGKPDRIAVWLEEARKSAEPTTGDTRFVILEKVDQVRAALLHKSRNYDEAIEFTTARLKSKPRPSRALTFQLYNLQLEALTKTGRLQESIKTARELCTVSEQLYGPNAPETFNIRGVIIENMCKSGDLRAAQAEVDAMINDNKKSPMPSTNVGITYLYSARLAAVSKQWSKAREHYAIAEKYAPLQRKDAELNNIAAEELAKALPRRTQSFKL